jgi:hypothetical protein
MRNVMRKTLVTVGIAVALAVGPGIGMANAAPTQLPTIPGLPIPEGGLIPQGLVPEGLIPQGLIPLPALGL